MTHQVKTIREPDPITCEIIGTVQSIAKAQGLSALLIGATARIILLEYVMNLPAQRATRDIDFAFAVRDWDQFHQIKSNLTAISGFFTNERIMHRLEYRPKNGQHAITVDLIPFGGVADANATIAWPPDASILMNVAGFDDALASAMTVKFKSGLLVEVASIPAMAVLKLFAWNDRRQSNIKDAVDLLNLFKTYHAAGNQDRIYDEATQALERTGYDVEIAGAWLLGRDACALMSKDTLAQLMKILDQPTKIDLLASDMSQVIMERGDQIGFSRQLLAELIAGLQD